MKKPKNPTPVLPGMFDVVVAVPAPVFDLPAGRRLRDVGIARVHAATEPEWLEEAYTALRHVCRQQATVTSDDIWRVMGAERMAQANPSALGVVFRRGVREGIIEATGLQASSSRAATHLRPLRVWRSKLFVGNAR